MVMALELDHEVDEQLLRLIKIPDGESHTLLDDLGVEVSEIEVGEVGDVVAQRELEAFLVQLAKAPVRIVHVWIGRTDAHAAVIELRTVVTLYFSRTVAV